MLNESRAVSGFLQAAYLWDNLKVVRFLMQFEWVDIGEYV
jgi:hypothetical protein